MNQFDLVDNWLNSVSYSHSQSKATDEQYKRVWDQFSSFIGLTAKEIVHDYENSDDRTFRRKYAQYIQAWIADLAKDKPTSAPEKNTNTSIKTKVGAVKSFFKYNDLPLGHIPQAMSGVVYHNRDLTKEEIVQIMAISKIREKAFFSVMAQSGLRPHTIKQLRMSNLETLDKAPPCKIEVPKEIAKGKFGSYVTFIGPDSIKYLKQYLATRTNITSESLLFCSHDDLNKPVNVKDMSRAFRLAARQLEKSGALSYKVLEGKPSELRLYCLRKFFRKYANQMGFENVNYLMGHTVRGSDANYKPQDPEFYRQQYSEKAMPFLRLETATPTETEKTITELKKQIEQKDQKLQEIEKKLTKIEPLLDFLSDYPHARAHLEALLKDLEEGRYARFESEHFQLAQYPRVVVEKLMKEAEAKGKDYVEFTDDQLRRMSLEERNLREKRQGNEKPQNT